MPCVRRRECEPWQTYSRAPPGSGDALALRCSPDGIRTRAAALRGRCPRPLDDGALLIDFGLSTSSGVVAHATPVAGVPGLEPRLTGPEPVGLPITPYPIGAVWRRKRTVPDAAGPAKPG